MAEKIKISSIIIARDEETILLFVSKARGMLLMILLFLLIQGRQI